MWRRLWGWLPALILMGTIFYISSSPAPEIFRKKYIFSQDKFIHIAVYFALAVFFARAFVWDRREMGRKWILIAIALSALYGISDEFHQSFVPERTSDIFDWFADLVGASLLFALQKPLLALLRLEKRLTELAIPEAADRQTE
ncbi:MAG: VanZ family protein [Candidatus Omnitrophica bacterium]|nr:VanZ family protein [Candidatus Omnitrophota bacterium]MCA9437147.1 VanZ family protein [Candidatus Omnitrophota bacterium]